jgi:hypothetical protein
MSIGTSNCSIITIGQNGISINIKGVINTSTINTTTGINASNASFTNVSFTTIANGSTTITNGGINTSTGLFRDITVTNINGQLYGTVSSNMSFTNLSVTQNFSMPSTAFMNVSNASFTNVSLQTLNNFYLYSNTSFDRSPFGCYLVLNNSSVNAYQYETTIYGNNAGLNTTGMQNSLFGGQCGKNITSGNTNVGMGSDTLYSLTTGVRNTAIGQGAMAACGQAVNENTAIGMFSQNIVNGNYNTAVGAFTDKNITNIGSNYNTAIGYNSSTSNNIAIVVNSTAIGANSTTGGFSNSTAIGYNSACSTNNQITLGTTAESVYIPGSLAVTSTATAASFSSTSDLRMKDIIRPISIEEAKKFLNNNSTVIFKWKKETDHSINSGYIAQEIIESGFEHLVTTVDNKDLLDGKQYVLNYAGIIPYYGTVIKHLMNEIEILKEQIKKYIN